MEQPIIKPDLTDIQKANFVSEFAKLVEQSVREKVKKLWNGQNINWVGNEPSIEGDIHMKFERKIADKYVTLLNRLNDRRI